MEQEFIENSVRTRLILAGISEIEKHGVNDFSLRRVALAAQVSCAAPYRHFKDKDELILGIIGYVREGWLLLSGQIGEIYGEDTRGLITELCVSSIRFWLGNRNFKTVLILGLADRNRERQEAMTEFDRPIAEAVGKYCESEKDADREELLNTVLALLYGTLLLHGGEGDEIEKSISMIRKRLSVIL